MPPADIESQISAFREEIKQRFFSELSKLRVSFFSRMNESARDVTTNEHSFRATSVDTARSCGDPDTLADRELQGRRALAQEIGSAEATAHSTVVLLEQELGVLERIMLNAMEQTLFAGSLKALLLGLNDSTGKESNSSLAAAPEPLPEMELNANLGVSCAVIKKALRRRPS